MASRPVFFTIGWTRILSVLLFLTVSLSGVQGAPEGKVYPPPNPNGKARLEPLEPPYDFGPVRGSEGKAMNHTFRFQNTGTETLKILGLTPSCECTAAVLSASDIAPGEIGSITTAIEIKGESGPQSVKVTVHTNDPTRAVHDFEIKGYLLADWKVVPVRLDLGTVGPGETLQKSLTVQSEYLPGEPTFAITALESDAPHVAAEIAGEGPGPDLTEGRYPVRNIQRNVVVTVQTDGGEGPGQANLTIRTSDPARPEIPVPVTWAVGGDIASNVEKLFLLQRGERRMSKELVITSRSGTPFEIEAFEAVAEDGALGDLAIEPKAGTSESQKVFEVWGQVVTTEKRLIRKGEIRITTKGSPGQTLTIPYTLTVSGG